MSAIQQTRNQLSRVNRHPNKLTYHGMGARDPPLKPNAGQNQRGKIVVGRSLVEATKAPFQKLNGLKTYQLIFALTDRTHGEESNGVNLRSGKFERFSGEAFKDLACALSFAERV